MRLGIGNTMIDIDEEATREYYAAHSGDLNDCTCAQCRNYRAAIPLFPEKVKAFFKDCGIDDMAAFVELTPYCGEDEGYLYGGWYHIVGSIEGGNPPNIWIPPAAKLRRLFCKFFNKKKYEALLRGEEILSGERHSDHLELSEDFSVWFSTREDLKADDFPENCIQLEIDAKIPWVLEEKPE